MKKIEQDLVNFKDYTDHEFQDIREKTATQIIKSLYQSLRLDNLFSQGIKDVFIVAEEWYLADIIAGEPVLKD